MPTPDPRAVQRLRKHLRTRDGVHPHHHLRQHFLVGLVLVAVFGSLTVYDTSKMTKSSIRDIGHEQAALQAERTIPMESTLLAIHPGEQAEVTVGADSGTSATATYFVLLSGPGRLIRADGVTGQEMVVQRADLPITFAYVPPPAGSGAPSVTISAHCISECTNPRDGTVTITLME